MAKIGRHRELLPLIFWFRVGHKLAKWHGMHDDTLFDQTKEEHAPMRGLAAVEPEREFIEISLQMIFFKGALMRTHQPSLNQRGNAVYARQDLVGVFAGALDGRSLVDVFVFGGAGVGCKPVGVDRRVRLDVLSYKRLECFSFCVGNNLQTAAPEALGGEQFNGNRHQHLAFCTAPAFAVPHTTEDGFINFDVSGQHLVPGMADCAPEPVQHRPGCLIGAKSKNSMQRFGGNTIFSCGHVPSGSEPNSQRRSGVMKDCASRGGDSISARITPPLTIPHTPALRAMTRRALKPIPPSNPVKVVEAGGVTLKPRQEFGVVARVINPRFGCLALSRCTL